MVRDGFIATEVLRERYELYHKKMGWSAATPAIKAYWADILSLPKEMVQGREWLEIFQNPEASLRHTIWQPYTLTQIHSDVSNIEITRGIRLIQVSNSSIPFLVELPEEVCNLSLVIDKIETKMIHMLIGMVTKMRVVLVKRGPRNIEIKLYYGIVENLVWDPRIFSWKDDKNVPIMNYSTKLDKEILKKYYKVSCVVEKKWSVVLPHSFNLRWATIWMMSRAKKEGPLVWAIWH